MLCHNYAFNNIIRINSSSVKKIIPPFVKSISSLCPELMHNEGFPEKDPGGCIA